MAQVPFNNQFQYTQTYLDAGFVSTGLVLNEQVRILGIPTYPGYPGSNVLTYGPFAIVALNSSGEIVNCDPSQTGQPEATAVGIISDQYITTAAVQAGNYARFAVGRFTVVASFLYATANNKSDVTAAMQSMGATYDPVTLCWSKF